MRLSTPDTYTEQLLYADGAAPRYTGCPTGRINILGGRYDYIFDAHDRLTRADYTPAADAANPDEDFSVVYTYDALARPKSVQRMGIIDLAADGTETFGCLDRLRYLYDDAGRVRTIGNDGDPDEYYGRPGFAAGGSEYEWDDAGRMTSDTGRGLTLIKYDHRNLPLQQRFETGLMQTNVYDAAGALVRTTMSSTAIRPTMRPTVRNYAANRVWEGGKLKYSYFTGGYFDGSGHVHYMHNDYQGSVVMVTDSAGTVEQRNTYYPYGEPHRTPSGQPRLYVGKERMAETDEYDYGARRHHPSGLLWSAPDRLARSTLGISPYVFCNANPIANIDPDGNVATAILAGGGAIIGAAIYSCTETFMQLFSDEKMNWSAVGGAAARGAVVGAVSGLTLGVGTAAAVAATGAANVAGGMLDRAVQGEEVLSTEAIVMDAAVGLLSEGSGVAIGNGAKKILDNTTPKFKGDLGEKITQLRFLAEGYEAVKPLPYKVETGRLTPVRKQPEKAHYDFLFRNKKTGELIVIDSKFNKSNYTKNQKLAIPNCKYPVEKDPTTSEQIGRWVRNSTNIVPAFTPSPNNK